jgi:ketosteroid isomerase-like protein
VTSSEGGGRRRYRATAIEGGTTASSEEESAEEANQAFYAAFEARDLETMSGLWEHTDRVVCTHPGWAVLRGWGQVAASFFALFQNDQHLQFILTNISARREGDVAWVSVDENILAVDQPATTVAALNIFVRAPEGGWRMVAHHASPVTGDADLADAPEDP